MEKKQSCIRSPCRNASLGSMKARYAELNNSVMTVQIPAQYSDLCGMLTILQWI